MKINRIEPSDKVKPFLKGLDLPRSYAGKINKPSFIKYCLQKEIESSVASETCKRFQDVYNTIAGARLFVALSQIKEFPEILQPDKWGYDWLRSRYVSDAILLYEASFDLLLQIPWIFFQVYKQYRLDMPKDLAEILRKCHLRDLNGNIDKGLYSFLEKFDENENQFISESANYIKHRQCLVFKDLLLSDDFAVIGNGYNSFQNLKVYSLDEVIEKLKKHNNKLVDLCSKVQLYIPF